MGEWLGQLFGNCPYEEVFFRGFLLAQCGLLAMRWMPRARPRSLVAVALVLSQALFALGHVFLNVHLPEGQWLLLAQFAFGIVFALVYLRTVIFGGGMMPSGAAALRAARMDRSTPTARPKGPRVCIGGCADRTGVQGCSRRS